MIATKGAIIPATVGVDLGCGMMAVRTTLDAESILNHAAKIRTEIERAIPVGREGNRKLSETVEDWIGKNPVPLTADSACISRAASQLGSLGGGNHFIEVCLDKEGNVWVMLHSGSRHVGKHLADKHINTAKGLMKKYFIDLPDTDLAYLVHGTQEFTDYVADLKWAQLYALKNREEMMDRILRQLSYLFNNKEPLERVMEVNCFAGETVVITKKGNRRISDLSGGTHELLTSDGNWVLAPVKSFGKSQLLKITLVRSGVLKTIYATPNHDWIIRNQQRKNTLIKSTIALNNGDRLECCFTVRHPNMRVSETGACRGFVFGDGSVSSITTSRASFCGDKDKDVLPLFIKNNFGKPPRFYKNNLAVINSLPRHWKTDFPELDDDKDYLYGWLAGYFAADGSVDKTGRPTINSADYSNMIFVRRICTHLGIGTFGIRSHLRKGFGKEKTPLYYLGLMRNDLCESFFIINTHRQRFLDSKSKDRRRWSVVSVEDTGRTGEVFCATVEGTHSFTLEDNILTRNCHHNYVAWEHHMGENVMVTRKGAVRARLGDMGIIPGSMGARSFIVRGLGNEDSFTSCSHGAGRKMSRTKARANFTTEDLIAQTSGVECRKDGGVLDELPSAYKSIEEVMANQTDLVEVVAELKQVVCVKG